MTKNSMIDLASSAPKLFELVFFYFDKELLAV